MRKFAFIVLVSIFCACGLMSPQARERLNVVGSSFSVAPNTVQSGFTGDLVSWSDSLGKARTAFLVNPTTSADPAGAYGGYARTLTYTKSDNTVRTVSHGATLPGAGFAVTQQNSTWTIFSSQFTPSGTRTVVAQGSDNVTIQYQWASLKSSGGSSTVNVKATAQWTFLTGRDYPVYAITFDTSAYSVGGYNGNANAPSADMEYSDLSTHTVDGDAWGDKYKFTTTSSPVSFSSTWTYNVANTIPYLAQWNNAATAETGLVQTQNYTDHDAGASVFKNNWTKTSSTRVQDGWCSISTQTMPTASCWTQQENNWQLPGNNTKKPIGWLMQYGAVGTNSASKYASSGSITGYPYQSYSTEYVLGAKGATAATVLDHEAAIAATFVASTGTVATSGPAGVGRSDTITYAQGYDPVYATFNAQGDGSAANAFVGTWNFGAKTLHDPVLRVLGKTTTPLLVHYDGAPLVSGTDYIASLDTTTNSLWLVLLKSVTGTHSIGVDDGTVDAGVDSGTPWTGVAVNPNQNVGGFTSDIYSWQDAQNQARTLALVHNDAVDPAGFYGGYARQATYYSGSSQIAVNPRSAVPDQPGWGYTLHHKNGGSDSDTMSSRRHTGTFRTVFAGRHHAMHEYAWTTLSSQGPPVVDRSVNTMVRWIVSTGSNAILWAHTVDTSPLGANALNADDRSPVGEWDYDGVEGAISGIGWGDRYKMRTTSSPVNFNSTWTYNVANTIPHTLMWTDSSALEQGVVQTETYTTKDAAYGWFYDNWNHTSSTRVVDGSGEISSQLMPVDWNWTYQSVQYNFPTDTSTKRFAWGVNFGCVGQTSYSRYGDDINLSGYPYRSSSDFYVLGAKGLTDTQVTQVERDLASTFSASVGTIATTGPFGIGTASGTSQTYATAGYDPVYGTWTVTAASNSAHVQWVSSGTIVNPVVRVLSYTGSAPTVTLNGSALTADVDYFASPVSYDGGNEMWFTLNRAISGTNALSIN